MLYLNTVGQIGEVSKKSVGLRWQVECGVDCGKNLRVGSAGGWWAEEGGVLLELAQKQQKSCLSW